MGDRVFEKGGLGREGRGPRVGGWLPLPHRVLPRLGNQSLLVSGGETAGQEDFRRIAKGLGACPRCPNVQGRFNQGPDLCLPELRMQGSLLSPLLPWKDSKNVWLGPLPIANHPTQTRARSIFEVAFGNTSHQVHSVA